jgi:hypothetical protein
MPLSEKPFSDPSWLLLTDPFEDLLSNRIYKTDYPAYFFRVNSKVKGPNDIQVLFNKKVYFIEVLYDLHNFGDPPRRVLHQMLTWYHAFHPLSPQYVLPVLAKLNQ